MSEETTTTEVAKAEEMNIEQICETAKKMKVSSDELVTNYYDFTIGETMKLMPLGVKRIEKMQPTQDDWANKRENEDKPMVSAIRFLNCDDGQFYISAAAVIVSTLEEHAINNSKEGSVKKIFNVECIEEKSSPKGKYLVFSIKPLI